MEHKGTKRIAEQSVSFPQLSEIVKASLGRT